MEERSLRGLRLGVVAAALTTITTLHCGGGSTAREKPRSRPSVLVGTVLDDAGGPVAGATIVVQGRTATSGPDGAFRIEGADEGSALVDVRAEGYHPRVVAAALSPQTGGGRVQVVR